MGKKAKIGITSDFLEDGKFRIPGLGLKLLDRIPNIEYEVLPDLLPNRTPKPILGAIMEIIPEQIRGFDIIVTSSRRWTQETLAGNNQLLCVHLSGVGYNGVDVAALTKAGVMLCITPEAMRLPVATAAVTLILALTTHLTIRDKLTRKGCWTEAARYQGDLLTEKTLGSIGIGNIGHEIFRLMGPFGMTHIAYDPYVEQEAVADVAVKLVDIDTVLSGSDFLNISCPLTQNTWHLIGEKELKKMKPTAFLINTARGPIIDESVLIRALQEKWIQGAGLDVFEEEPIPPDNPLLKLDNVIVTPHRLARMVQGDINIWDEIIRHLSQIAGGKVPDGLVNKEVLEIAECFKSKFEAFR